MFAKSQTRSIRTWPTFDLVTNFTRKVRHVRFEHGRLLIWVKQFVLIHVIYLNKHYKRSHRVY
ncbi:hypothetical protein SlsnVgp064 [Spodoptera littoralis nucleopolyhedrovirus]|uniref:Uncharacterized protein n=1 Tax=Spodoptera littoralis nuclear polyhedrosis virus TaxID=10456 RepID=M1J4A2_NPVSL|nr:hypothetical protein SlsnVgp064 [Spodoptera littoralis nucleopolyhedrovirus]AGE89919.1 hypothetical protein SlsnVgp064 [Spodoptera littoralis nucleopolyhedrovirus]